MKNILILCSIPDEIYLNKINSEETHYHLTADLAVFTN